MPADRFGLTAAKWACARLEGMAFSYLTQRRNRVTLNSVKGALDLSLRWCATQEEIARTLTRVVANAYQPDPTRLDQVRQLAAFGPAAGR